MRLKTCMKETIKQCWEQLKKTQKMEIYLIFVNGNTDCYLGINLGNKCLPSLRGEGIKSVKGSNEFANNLE